jgi:hypothetical protein
MALKQIRFVWGTPPLAEGRWRLGLFNLHHIPDAARPSRLPPGALPSYWKKYLHHGLHLSVRGLLAWGAAAAVIAWFAGAALLLQRLERGNPHARVTYLDLALPTRWDQLERLRGEGHIAQGREALERGEFVRGFGLLRLGLAKNPTDHAARLEVARLYAALRLRVQAEQLLLDGLAHGYPGRDHLEFAFALAADSDRPEDRLALVRRARDTFAALPAAARSADEALWLDRELLRALRAAERPDEALAFLENSFPEDHPLRREHTAIRLLELGRASEAVALAEAWAAAEPRSPEPLRLLVRAQRESGDFAAMGAALARLRALDPAQPDALLHAYAQNRLSARPEAAQAALDELLFRHGASAGTYTAAAALALELRDEPSLARLEAALHERGLSPRPVHWARLQLALLDRDWPALLARADDVRTSPGAALNDTQRAWLDTTSRLARACLDAATGTQASLVEIVTDRPGTLRLYRTVLEALLEAGRPATARQILTLAEGPYQNARAILALRARVEAALAAAAPEPEPARPGPRPELASAEALARAFSERIRTSDTEGGLALLAAARRARPAWLPAAEATLEELELPVRARGDDPLRLQFLARAALVRDREAPARLLALAREIQAEAPAHRPQALLLVKEVIRHNPDHGPALALLADWEPRRPLSLTDTMP